MQGLNTRTRTRPQGPGQGQRPAPQGQGPDPKNQYKDLKYVLKESFRTRTRINITGNNKQHLSFIRTPSILHVPDSIRVSFAYNSTMLHFIYNSRRLRILDRGGPLQCFELTHPMKTRTRKILVGGGGAPPVQKDRRRPRFLSKIPEKNSF